MKKGIAIVALLLAAGPLGTHAEEAPSTLNSPAWTNAGSLVPFDSTTNWTDPTGPGNSAFYRLVIP